MHSIKDIKKILSNCDYLPEVKQCGDGCIIKMPHPVLITPNEPRLIEAYAVQRGKYPGVYFNSTVETQESFLAVPEYGVRLLIQCAIVVNCQHVGVDPRLLTYYNEEGDEVSDFTKVIGSPNDRAKEGFLITLFTDARNENFPAKYDQVAMTHHVGEGYRLCKSFIL